MNFKKISNTQNYISSIKKVIVKKKKSEKMFSLFLFLLKLFIYFERQPKPTNNSSKYIEKSINWEQNSSLKENLSLLTIDV